MMSRLEQAYREYQEKLSRFSPVDQKAIQAIRVGTLWRPYNTATIAKQSITNEQHFMIVSKRLKSKDEISQAGPFGGGGPLAIRILLGERVYLTHSYPHKFISLFERVR